MPALCASDAASPTPSCSAAPPRRPSAAAIAAGNAAVIKPSEVSAHSAFVIQDLVSRYLDPEAIRVVQGGVDETTAVLRERFDHILYTGNGAVGRIIMRVRAWGFRSGSEADMHRLFPGVLCRLPRST